MPSFDVVSEVDHQEVRNAVDQASRELHTRFDFIARLAALGVQRSRESRIDFGAVGEVGRSVPGIRRGRH